LSGFIAATSGWQIIGLQDLRLNRPDFQRQALFVDGWNAVAPATFETEWWPKGGGFIGDGGADVGLLEAAWWGEFDPAAGAASRYGFVGVTRDALGTAVGSCVVKLFRTSDDLLLDSTTSDPSGNFLLNTPYYPDAHYIVAHKTGSPDIDGATVNTLIGT
jgi:hypothetical protein